MTFASRPVIRSSAKLRGDTFHSSILLAQVSLLAILFTFLYFHVSTLLAYLAISGAISGLSGLAFFRKITTRWIFIHSFLLYLSLRLVYFFATQFQSIPFGDPYWDLGVVNTFVSDNKVSLIEQPLFPSRQLTWYSSWPVLHTLETSIIQLTGLPTEGFHMLFTFFLSGLTFVFSFLFIREVAKALNLQSKFMYLAVVFLSLSPETIFWGLAPTRQELGLLLMTMCLYLVAKALRQRSRPLILTAILSAITLAIAHHFTAIVATGAFAFAAILSPPRFVRVTYFTIASILAVSILLWWTGYADIIFEAPAFKDIKSDTFNIDIQNLRFTAYPDQLTPNWALFILRSRDVILNIMAVVGGLVLLKKRNDPQVRFLLALGAAAGLMLLVNLGIRALEPTRVIMLFLPVLMVFAAVGYSQINRLKVLNKQSSAVIVAGIMVFAIFGSFVGLWGHDFAPIHLYENSINGLSVGEHSTTAGDVKAFLNNRVNYTRIDKFVSEGQSPLVLDLPASQYGKIKTMRDTLPIKDGRTMVVSTEDLYVYKYFAGYFAGKKPEDIQALRGEIAYRLSSFDSVYSDGSNRVWK